MNFILRFIRITTLRDLAKGIILIVCFSFGMLIGAIFLCQANQAIYSYQNLQKQMSLDNIVIVETEDSNKSINTDQMKSDLNFVKDIYPYCQLAENIAVYQDQYIAGNTICSTDDEFDQCFTMGYEISGNWFRQENECVIGSKLSKRYQIKTGDSIIIGVGTYRVTGILAIPRFDSFIFIPDTDMKELSNKIQYYIALDQLSEEKQRKLDDYLRAEYGDVQMYPGNGIIENERNRLNGGWGPTIIISSIALLYGIINIINIERFYFYKRRTAYGVMLAYGATYQQIYAAIYLESGFYSFISSMVTFLLVYLLQYTSLNYVISMRVNGIVLFIITCFSQIYSMLYAYLIIKGMKKQRLVEIFKSTI